MSNEYENYRSVLKSTLSYVEDSSFSWDDVVGFLVIKLSNTDCLKTNKNRSVSNATQIQLTSRRDADGDVRPTEDFFPTLTLNTTFKSWRISVPTRISLKNTSSLEGTEFEGDSHWRMDCIQIRRRLLNGENGNPALHICYGDDLKPLRELLGVNDYLVIVKRKSDAVYEAFGVKSDVDLGNGKGMYLQPETSRDKDSTVFAFADLTEARVCGGRNVLLYGVPGCGKSYMIKHTYCKDAHGIERVVFHPDYTYGDFVGQILPITDEEGKIKYEFSPGPFTRILRQAIDNPTKKYCLVIEEINRGNAPAIFGDIFQLLDRDDIGNSAYEITNTDVAEKVYGEDSTGKVTLPPNLFILATMNTSDQNVFTLDTAFQRRWNMRMVENDVSKTSIAKKKILDTSITWAQFNDRINSLILSKNVGMASSEDKRLGAYFVTENDLYLYTSEDGISEEEADDRNRNFPEKVLKYLWDDAFKFTRDEVFKSEHDSLEKLIKAFESAKGDKRFGIFVDDIFGLNQDE